jgi:hypothetical protein
MPRGVVRHKLSSTRDPGPANTHRVFPQVTDHQIPPQKQHIKRRARSVHRRKPVGVAAGLLGAVPQHRLGDEVRGGCRLGVELLSQGAQLLRGEGVAGLMAGLAGREDRARSVSDHQRRSVAPSPASGQLGGFGRVW